jgi:valyl-tRNA synthetase
MTLDLPPRYDAKQIEAPAYALWEQSGHFHTEPERQGQAYTIVIPPPNVTGALHMGHALNNTLQDVLIRWRRMQGWNTLWLPGTDHAGIATQNVVERELAREGSSRREVGREGFLERVWAWREQYGSRIINQLKKLGSSCDWDRTRFTMDEGLSRAVLEAFNRLYENGLLFRGKYIVNWCPHCQTTLADDEVDHEDHEGHLWHIHYPVKGSDERVTVATTRPETMLGDMAVAVNPSDGRYGALVGKTLLLPLTEREIPVIADEWVDPEFGTGAVKVTPAHDPNDFEIGRRHELEPLVVMNEDGSMNLAAGDEYVGQDRFECREVVIEELREKGLLGRIEPHVHAVGHCYRCHSVVEPYLSDQWFVRMKPLAEKAIAATRDGRVSFHPERWTSYYLSWLENVRDWPISRQIWWGHRIPVWYCLDCNADEAIRPSEATGDAYRFREGAKPIVAREAPETCPDCGGSNLVQDADVLDTWFSSALWPFSTLGWPEETAELKRYYPTSTLVTDRGIIFFWVARMVMMGLEMRGEEPFSDVYIHGTILDEIGRKMSKSLGNGIDPIIMIDGGVQPYLGKEYECDGYGADAVRFSLLMLTTEGQDVKLSPTRFEMGRNFANKLWNAARLILTNLDEAPAGPGEARTAFEDEWILSRTSRTVREVTRLLEEFKFHETARTLYEFFWHDLCDWYVEMVKGRLYEGETEDRRGAQQTLAYVLDTSLRLLHPLVPFITEFLWGKLKSVTAASGLALRQPMDAEACIVAAWPEGGAGLEKSSIESEMDLVQEVIRGIRSLRKDKGVPDRSTVRVHLSCPDQESAGVLNARTNLLRSQAGLEDIECGVGLTKPSPSATAVVGTIEVFMALEGLIDVAKERGRLEKQADKLRGLITLVTRKLENPSFREKAPREIVDREFARERELREQLQVVEQNLAELG